MTLDEFVKKYKNGVDYDGAYGKQCVDYVNEYAKDVLGIKNAFVGPYYAYQCYTEYNNYPNIKNNFNRIANGKTNHPNKGDVIVWAKERNDYAGHIAVVLGATEHTIKVAEQNYDGNGSVREYTYPNYNNVLGWLVPKNKKVNEPKVKVGQVITLKTGARLYNYDSSKSGVKKIKDFSSFNVDAEAVFKPKTKIEAKDVKHKSNGNIWVKTKYGDGWICVYDYKNDISKI